MRVVTLGLALAVLAARPAGAGRILYATAASAGRVDGFCIANDGSLAPTPIVSVDTVGGQPRKLLVANGVLYVAEIDRVESFRIGPAGGLTDRRSTQVLKKTNNSGANVNIDPHDVAVHPSGKTLYVPQRKVDRLVAYPLDEGGISDPNFETCVQGEVNVNFQNLIPTDALLYVSGGNFYAGTVNVFAVDADGRLLGGDGLPSPPTACQLPGNKQKRSDATPRVSTRTKLSQPKGILLNGDLLYVEERGRKRIAVFRLGSTSCLDGNVALPGNFCPLVPRGKKGKKMKPQQAEAKTTPQNNYEGFAFDPTSQTILGAQFFRGRIDTYRLRADGLTPSGTTQRSKEDLRMSPVGIQANGRFLYVAAGAWDRVVAFPLTEDGLMTENGAGPSSLTDISKNSFPNDVAIAVLSAGCD